MKDTDHLDQTMLDDSEGHECPRCHSKDISFVTPKTFSISTKVYRNPKTGKVESSDKTPDGQYYRFMCKSCKLSTRNHINLMRAISEWNSFTEIPKEE